jgi:hypothetical protein
MSGSSESGPSLIGRTSSDGGQDSPDGPTVEAGPVAREAAAAEPRPWTALLTGAIGGAVAAILITFLLNAAGWLDRPDPLIAERVATLEGVAPELRGEAGRLKQRLAAVEQRPIPEPDLTPLRDDAAALRNEVAALREALANQQAGLETARGSLDQGLRELRETTGGLALSLSGQRARIEALAAERPDLQPLTEGLAAVQAAAKAWDGRLAELTQRVEPLTEGLAAAQAAAEAQEGRLAELTKRVEALESTLVATRVDTAETTGLALALVELDRAFDAGEPLASALEPFVPLARDPAVAAPLELLQPLRAEGAPTVADLQARLAELRPRVAEATGQPGAADWLGQTAQNLAGLVDLRRVDADAAAATGRLDEAQRALERGEVDAAVEALRPLAENGNAAAADWLAEARRRLDGEAGVERLRAYLAAHMPAGP